MDSNEARQKAAAEQQPNLDVTITKVGTSSVNPGEAGDPDTIIVRASIQSSLGGVTLSQSVGVTVQLDSGSIRKDYDTALLEARKRAAQVFDAVARNLQT